MAQETMQDFMSQYDVKRLNRGEILEGVVIDVNDKEVVVNINYAFDGLILKEELTVDGRSPLEVVSKGDEIKVYVISPNDGEGYVALSRIKALAVTEKDDLNKAFKNEEVIKVYVKEEVKGGLVAYYGSTRIFIPGSLASRERVKLNTLVGKELEVKLTEVDFKNRKIVASRRVIEEEIYNTEKKAIWAGIKSGEKRKGIVKRIVKFGAFVDIGGVEGLLHLSDMAWERVKRAEDVVNVGDEVEVFVGNVDPVAEKLSLILKDVNKEPWKVHGDAIKVSDVLEGKVIRLTSFGAFVEVFPGVEGLVHITEITDENITKPEDVLKVGQKVKVKVLNINPSEKKLSLTIKDATEKTKEYLQYVDGNDEGLTLGDLFKDLKL
ncbi:MAG: 30S ribosomal protein S1 [Clostridium sp.]